MASRKHWISINRAPVLTLWSAVVAERLGFKRAEALTMGRAVAGLNAYSKGKALGLFEPSPKKLKNEREAKAKRSLTVKLLGRAVPVTRVCSELRALSKDKPIEPAGVDRYLQEKFGEAYADARAAMTTLCKAYKPAELADEAYELYEAFRPEIPSGKKGWGAAGRLSLDKIRAMAENVD